jgi:hypothetical protein
MASTWIVTLCFNSMQLILFDFTDLSYSKQISCTGQEKRRLIMGEEIYLEFAYYFTQLVHIIMHYFIYNRFVLDSFDTLCKSQCTKSFTPTTAMLSRVKYLYSTIHREKRNSNHQFFTYIPFRRGNSAKQC